MKSAFGAMALLLGATTFAVSQPAQSNQATNPQPAMAQISADRGTCRVDFRVTDAKGKPVYDAKIHAQVRWGLAHKLDLDIGTNADGRARFINMPNTVKKPIVFEIRNGADEAMISWDPGNNCEAEYTVPLIKKSIAK